MYKLALDAPFDIEPPNFLIETEAEAERLISAPILSKRRISYA